MNEHRKCFCGCAEPPKLYGSPHDPKQRGLYVICPGCGCRSVTKLSWARAWAAWDDCQLQRDEENLTIYEMMEETNE